MHRLLIAVVLLMLAPLATAQVYKWTDASGTVHYSEAPPAKGIRFSKVTTTGTVEPLTKPPAAAEAGDSSKTSHETMPMADTPANRKSLCSSLEANLATLRGSGPVVMQKDGKTTALDDTQRKQQLDTTQSQYDQYCKG
ncbi:MAG TPA: DUF4124 domain-containing protein [Rhodanobacter sp.]|nr:DUF4124 domain-containing protein [Rhodanobacter sp.]